MAKLPPPDPRFLKVLPILQDGLQLYNHARFDQAEERFLRVLKKAPDNPDALYFLGLTRLRQQKASDALHLLTKAAKSNPRFAEAHFVAGTILVTLNRPQDALAAYRRAIAIDASHVNALNHLGNVLGQLGQWQEAISAYDRAIAAAPQFAGAYNNRGTALVELGQLDAALSSFEQAAALQADFAEAHNNRGGVLQKLNRPADAISSYDRALAIKSDFASAINNRGVALQDLNRHHEAKAWHRQALALRPDDAEAHFNLASAHLALGEFAKGWLELEWRWRKKDLAHLRRKFPQPEWLGDGPISGKTILLHAEQGFGDSIQFLRYAPLVAARGARVVLEAPRPLLHLLQSVAGPSQLVCRGEKLPPFDLHTPLLSLPSAFRTEMESIPRDVPYLSAAPDRIAKWKGRLPKDRRRTVGVAWCGRAYPRNRSILLAELEPLLSTPNVLFVSLQQELPDHELGALAGRPNVLHFGSAIEDFADTAAIISCLDIVLSIDTSVAHLAGALAKPLWLLLLFSADFRWLLDRNDSPWYPTARLFRQPAVGDWASVVERVAKELSFLP